MAKLNEKGHEILDSRPIAMPVNFKRPPTLQETIKQLIRTQLSQQAAEQGHESFEESDDFDVGEDFEPSSPWELQADQEAADTSFQEEKPIERKSKKSDSQPGPTGSAPISPPVAQVAPDLEMESEN